MPGCIKKGLFFFTFFTCQLHPYDQKNLNLKPRVVIHSLGSNGLHSSGFTGIPSVGLNSRRVTPETVPRVPQNRPAPYSPLPYPHCLTSIPLLVSRQQIRKASQHLHGDRPQLSRWPQCAARQLKRKRRAGEMKVGQDGTSSGGVR